jgi:hypothetical protein
MNVQTGPAFQSVTLILRHKTSRSLCHAHKQTQTENGTHFRCTQHISLIMLAYKTADAIALLLHKIAPIPPHFPVYRIIYSYMCTFPLSTIQSSPVL